MVIIRDSFQKSISETSHKPSIAICLLSKNENEDINEYIDYHKSIGISKIILWDDNSIIPMHYNISHHISSQFVLYHYLTTHHSPNNQLFAYAQCLQRYRHIFTHIGFFDTDEFLVIKEANQTLVDIVARYPNAGGLALNWMLFGSSGHIQRPTGGVLANYNQCVRNCHIKTLVNTKHVLNISDGVHHFIYKPGFRAVDTSRRRVRKFYNPRMHP